MAKETAKTKDEIVQDLIAIVQKKKAEIEKLQKPTWETNCVFTIDGKVSNIRTITSTDTVLKLTASLITERKAFNEAAEILGLNGEFRFGGFTFDQWVNDFKNIAGNITIKEKLESLKKDEDALDKMVSKEKREEMELAAIAARLGA